MKCEPQKQACNRAEIKNDKMEWDRIRMAQKYLQKANGIRTEAGDYDYDEKLRTFLMNVMLPASAAKSLWICSQHLVREISKFRRMWMRSVIARPT
jgi:hypothetical protein